MSSYPGLLLVISGPSGVGKSTVIHRLMADKERLPQEAYFSISATTRPPRGGEADGRHYHFYSRERFEKGLAEGAFLEHARYAGHLYGTPAAPVIEGLQKGRCIFMDIDVQGAMQIRKHLPEAVLIFLMPPDKTELERRLRARRSDSDEKISLRLALAEGEFAHVKAYDYIIVNDLVENAVADLAAVIRAEFCRVSRALPRL